MILGKGPAQIIAREGALKIKEVTYIHAETFSAGEMKHGPIALIDSQHPGKTKVILVILDDEHFDEMDTCLSEVKSRHAYTVVITDCYNKLNHEKID